MNIYCMKHEIISENAIPMSLTVSANFVWWRIPNVENGADLEKGAIWKRAPFSSKENYFGSLGEPDWNLVLFLRGEPFFPQPKRLSFNMDSQIGPFFALKQLPYKGWHQNGAP